MITKYIAWMKPLGSEVLIRTRHKSLWASYRVFFVTCKNCERDFYGNTFRSTQLLNTSVLFPPKEFREMLFQRSGKKGQSLKYQRKNYEPVCGNVHRSNGMWGGGTGERDGRKPPIRYTRNSGLSRTTPCRENLWQKCNLVLGAKPIHGTIQNHNNLFLGGNLRRSNGK